MRAINAAPNVGALRSAKRDFNLLLYSASGKLPAGSKQ